jgi:hypothetical protein
MAWLTCFAPVHAAIEQCLSDHVNNRATVGNSLE